MASLGNVQEARIVGGQDVADPTRYPYFTYIEFIARRGNRTVSYSCGGTLVHDDAVLTTAHCWGDNVLFARAFVNATDFQNTKYEYPSDIVSHVLHANFSQSRANDIMLLFLHRAFPEVPKVQLDPIWTPPTVGTHVTAIGFGDLYFGGGFDDHLQEVQIAISDFNECDKVYGGQLEPSLQVCAAYPGRDTCHGDSGGPLLVSNGAGEDVQIGITSFGYQCAKVPGVYVLVQPKMDWIREQICLSSRVEGWCPTSIPSSWPSLYPEELPSSQPSDLPSLLYHWSNEPSFDPSFSEAPSSLSSESMEPSALPSWLSRVEFAQEKLHSLDISASTTQFCSSWMISALLLRSLI